MKVFKFSNSDDSLQVEYLTDSVSNSENFTIYQVKTIVAGVEQIGLTDAAIEAGFTDEHKEVTLQAFIAFAEAGTYSLKSYENTANGSESHDIVTPIYAGGGIGQDIL